MNVVNAYFLTRPTTGIQRYAIELSLRLKQMDSSVRFVCSKDVYCHDIFERLEAEVIGNHTGHLWCQVDLPWYLKKQKNPLLINFDTVNVPIFYRNKVVVLHDILPIRYSQYSWKFSFLWRLTHPFILNNALSLVTVSNFSKEEIRMQFKSLHKDIHVIYNAVGDVFIPNKDKDKVSHPYLLAVSSQKYHKNIGRLIEAFDDLYKSGKLKISLVLIGGSYLCRKKYIYTSSANAAIRFMGRVTDKELVGLYQGATAFVFPSLYEGFGLPPLEAQACGCPVIASKVASIPEVLGDSVLYFDPNDVSDMQKALCRVSQDSFLREQLIEKGRANVYRFSWNTSARQLYELIVSLQK
jgi:glycosyltransferase involved in cell wall biosynthesis